MSRETLDLSRQRAWMVEAQIAGRGISDERILAAMRRVPREAFVPEGLREFAYDDGPLPIGAGQTISQPYIVALMIGAAQLHAGDRVLEIGTGSGYAAAVMSLLAAEIYTIERIDALVEGARRRFHGLGYGNIHARCGDGTAGWPEAAPFEAILVAAGGSAVPELLLQQLAQGGRLVMPVGRESRAQRLIRLWRIGDCDFEEEDYGGVSFVPLIGASEQGEALTAAVTPPAAAPPRGAPDT